MCINCTVTERTKMKAPWRMPLVMDQPETCCGKSSVYLLVLFHKIKKASEDLTGNVSGSSDPCRDRILWAIEFSIHIDLNMINKPEPPAFQGRVKSTTQLSCTTHGLLKNKKLPFSDDGASSTVQVCVVETKSEGILLWKRNNSCTPVLLR